MGRDPSQGLLPITFYSLILQKGIYYKCKSSVEQYSQGLTMFFKKKVAIGDYCSRTLDPLFSEKREAEWETTRFLCNDDALNRVDRDRYFTHLRAIVIQRMLIAVTKTYGIGDVSSDAHVFVLTYLNARGLEEIDSLQGEYNRAFATSSDGVLEMVHLFSTKLTGSKMKQATIERFHQEFYAILRALFDEFKSIKLVAT